MIQMVRLEFLEIKKIKVLQLTKHSALNKPKAVFRKFPESISRNRQDY